MLLSLSLGPRLLVLIAEISVSAVSLSIPSRSLRVVVVVRFEKRCPYQQEDADGALVCSLRDVARRLQHTPESSDMDWL